MAASDGVSYDLTKLKAIPKYIREIERKGQKVEKPLKRWGTYMLGQTGYLFRYGKRGPVKWKELAPVTKIMRRYRKRGGSRTGPQRPLQDTRALERSIRTVTFTRRATRAQAVYTKAPHAKTHQDGGEIKIPRRVIKPKKPGGVLAFKVGGETVFARKVVQPAKVKRVPQRKVVFITAADKRKGFNLLKQHAEETVKTTGKR